MLKRWAIADFTIDTETELLTAQADKETVLISLLISNSESADAAEITVTHTDGANTIFSWTISKEAGESPTAIDSVIVMEPGDKLYFRSNKGNVSVLASGEEK